MQTRGNIGGFRSSAIFAIALAASALTGPAQAESVTFVLDQSDRLRDGVGYLQVQMTELQNGVHFTVQPLQPLTDGAGKHFGITSFGFNVAGLAAAGADDVIGLDRRWHALDNKKIKGFGRFDVLVKGPSNPQSVLSFSVTGIDLDQLADFALLSTGKAANGQALFAGKVRGLDFDGKLKNVRGATFAAIDASPVPVPAAGWLLGTACLLAARWGRRRHR